MVEWKWMSVLCGRAVRNSIKTNTTLTTRSTKLGKTSDWRAARRRQSKPNCCTACNDGVRVWRYGGAAPWYLLPGCDCVGRVRSRQVGNNASVGVPDRVDRSGGGVRYPVERRALRDVYSNWTAILCNLFPVLVPRCSHQCCQRRMGVSLVDGRGWKHCYPFN